MNSGSGSKLCTRVRGSLIPTLTPNSLHLQHLQRVAEVDAATVLRLELQAVERLDGLADEERPALRVERAVGAEQDVPGAVEIDAALDRGFGAVDRGVAVEHLEIIQRPLLHAL